MSFEEAAEARGPTCVAATHSAISRSGSRGSCSCQSRRNLYRPFLQPPEQEVGLRLNRPSDTSRVNACTKTSKKSSAHVLHPFRSKSMPDSIPQSHKQMRRQPRRGDVDPRKNDVVTPSKYIHTLEVPTRRLEMKNWRRRRKLYIFILLHHSN